LANGGTGASTAAVALANLGGLPLAGGTLTGALTAPQLNGPLAGNVTGNVAGNVTGNVTGNVSGTAANVTGTVGLGNGGTGASTVAGALANLLPGVTSNGANGVGVAGNVQFNGTLQVGGLSTLNGTTTVENQLDAEVDAILWAGFTQSQKESLIYKDWNGNNQWYAEKDQYNNWVLNSAVGGLDSFKAYQSTNTGDTYVNASNPTGVVRVNYETGSGAGFKVYGGNSNAL
jgi:cytoskeletal protein CcmA (bactofilin family)